MKKMTKKQWLNQYGYAKRWYSSEKYYKYVDVVEMEGTIDTYNDYWLVIDLRKNRASVETAEESINITEKEYKTIGILLDWAKADFRQMLEESVEKEE